MASPYPGALDALPTNIVNNSSSFGSTNPIAAEDGPHPKSHNDANAAINAIQTTLGIDPQGGETDVAARLTAIEAALGGGASTITDVYLASGSPHTWTKDAAAKQVDVYMVGPGGGGNSGATAASSANAVGGGGGSAGAFVRWMYLASELPSTVTVTVASSTGGAAVSADTTAGNVPTQPSDTTFGGLLRAKAGRVGAATTGAGALQNSVNVHARGIAATQSLSAGAGGGSAAGSEPGTTSPVGLPTPGGGGGAVQNTNVAHAGGNGGTWANASTVFPALAAAVAGTANGGNGANGAQSGIAGMGGAGGGGGNPAGGNGGGGGAGGFPGGGGGGGGGARNGSSSGAGGKGGDGVCIVVQHL